MLNRQRLFTTVLSALYRGLIVLFFALLVLYASRQIVDLDLWLHLKAGETILRLKTIPLVDIFSFTKAGTPWINHEWLFQVACFLCYTSGGPDGLIIMQNIVLIGLFLVLFFIGNDGTRENFLFVFCVLYTTLLATAYRFSIRPDLFSLFFVVLYLFILRGWAAYKARALWILPLLQILWTNMHGFFFLGPAIVLIYLLGESLKRVLPLPAEWKECMSCDRRQMKDLLLVFFCLILASTVNPQGLTGAAYPFLVGRHLIHGGDIIFKNIEELARPLTFKTLFDVRHMLYLKVLIIISLFSFRFNSRRVNATELLLWGVFLFFGLSAVRNMAYFCLVAAYVSFQNINRAFDNGKEWPRPPLREEAGKLVRLAAVAGLIFFPVKGALGQINAAAFDYDTYELKSAFLGIAPNRYPEKAVTFLLKENFPERILNDFNSGAYLIGRAFPKRRVFIDGRTELYGTDFLKDYIDLGAGEGEAIRRLVKTYDIQGFFLTAPSNGLHIGLLRTLLNSGWKTVYFDERAIILLKDTPANAALIRKYGFDLKQWVAPEPDYMRLGIAFRYPWPQLNRARLLSALEFYDAAAREARVALNIEANNSEAMRYVADEAYYAAWDPRQAFIWIRNGLVLNAADLMLRTRLALVTDALGDREKALKVIRVLNGENPNYAEGFYTKALILQYDDPEAAMAAARTAVTLVDKNPRYRELLGDLLMRDGQVTAAERMWQEALRYDSANADLAAKIKDATAHADVSSAS